MSYSCVFKKAIKRILIYLADNTSRLIHSLIHSNTGIFMDLAFEQYYFCYLHYFNVVSTHANLTLKIVDEPEEREF